MDFLERLAEEKIRAAMEAGVFDNLPGKGQPLKLEENPYEPEDWRLVFSLLRKNGFSLPWMETWRGIEADLVEARTRLRQALGTQNWEQAKADFLGCVEALNRRIFNYNLQVPLTRFQRPIINPYREIAMLIGDESSQAIEEKDVYGTGTLP
jgi:DnaJ family protein C protein 28